MWWRTRIAVGRSRRVRALKRALGGAAAPTRSEERPPGCLSRRVAARAEPALQRRNPRGGFTLIELLVVIAVISVLAGLVGPMVFRNVGDAKSSAAKAQIELLGLALEQYRLDNDHYPSTAQGLQALRSAPTGEPAARNWRGPYLRKSVPLDSWDRPYLYRSPGTDNPESYDLLCYGRDGAPGGTGEDGDIGR